MQSGEAVAAAAVAYLGSVPASGRFTPAAFAGRLAAYKLLCHIPFSYSVRTRSENGGASAREGQCANGSRDGLLDRLAGPPMATAGSRTSLPPSSRLNPGHKNIR